MFGRKDISVIVPVYNEEESIPELCEWIVRIMNENNFTYEIILVDDGSTDTSWEIIQSLSQNNPRIKGLQFGRNYGKSAALDTGFDYASGRVVITMDADLQDSPDEIPELYRMITVEKYDLVSGWKKRRLDPPGKTIPSKFFNYVTRKISGLKLHDFNCGLKAYNAIVVKNISIYGELHRYIPVIAKWNGFKRIGEKVVEHRPRKYGITKFGMERLIFGFLDLLSLTFVSKFNKKPMHFFGSLGILSFFVGLIFIFKITWEKIYALHFSNTPIRRDIVDQPLFYLALVAIVVGIQLFLTGFIAELFTINNIKKRDYLIKDRLNLKE